MRAIGKHIVLKEVKENSVTTKGGLVLGEKHREDIRYRQGVVELVGEGIMVIKPGDEIYFDRHAGCDLEVKNNIYKVIKEQDVVIVL